MGRGADAPEGSKEIDRQILALLNRRAELLAGAHAEGRADLMSQEERMLRELLADNPGPLRDEDAAAVFRELLSILRRLVADVEVSYLGPEASFTHQAAFRRFGSAARMVSCDSIPSVFRDVESGRSSFSVVPVENSTEGAVTYTLDLLVQSSVQICAEINLRISHCLMSEAPIEEVSAVYSHPQVFGQCREWISERLPHAELREVKSTADAAAKAKADGNAAIASRMASELYGLPILRESIEDNPDNSTRFLVLARDSPPPTGDDKTSICFALRDRAGALYDALHSFKKEDINLTMIQSRPSRMRNWDYIFFVDMEGHMQDDDVSRALSELAEGCVFLRVLGSYPRNDELL